MGEEAWVRAVCGVPDRGRQRCFVLGSANGLLSGRETQARRLAAVLTDTHLESICCQPTAVWYDFFVRMFLQAGLR
jgi:hypothetical protein